MKNEETGKLDSRKIKFMLDNDLIDDYFYLEDVGNYLTTVFLNKYLDEIIDKDKLTVLKDKRKCLIEVFQRMRKKYNYAYYVDKPLNVLICENKQSSIFNFILDDSVKYPRVVFTNYDNLNDFYKIELNPDYYRPDILKKCLYEMNNIKSSSKFISEIYQNIDIYSNIKETLEVPTKILTQLEMRYIFSQTKFYPYEIETNKNDIENRVLARYDCIEFSEVLDFLKISEQEFYNVTQKRKSSNGMFINELNHLKKYLTLEYIHKNQWFPYKIQKENLHIEEYKTILRETIIKYLDKLVLLYKLLVIPLKIYDVYEFHSKEYKKMFNYYKSQGYSKWQTQEIMRRYRYITEQMQIEPPEELTDMIDMFLANFKYSYFQEDNYIDFFNSLEKY